LSEPPRHHYPARLWVLVGWRTRLDQQREEGIPLTRQNWIDISYPGGPPKEWGAELESEVPKMFQKDAA
jgi:hypothetical protein